MIGRQALTMPMQGSIVDHIAGLTWVPVEGSVNGEIQARSGTRRDLQVGSTAII